MDVFRDQQKALRQTSPDLLTAWHWLTTIAEGEGFNAICESLRGSAKPSGVEAADAINTILNGNACQTHTSEAIENSGQNAWELAYALAWISVSGGNSAMPPWVRYQFPGAGRLVRQLRDTPCANAACGWCRDRHDPRSELTPMVRIRRFPGKARR